MIASKVSCNINGKNTRSRVFLYLSRHLQWIEYISIGENIIKWQQRQQQQQQQKKRRKERQKKTTSTRQKSKGIDSFCKVCICKRAPHTVSGWYWSSERAVLFFRWISVVSILSFFTRNCSHIYCRYTFFIQFHIVVTVVVGLVI